MEIRLQKYMADCGVASRRKSEEYIQEGLVKVNGEIVRELGTKVNPKVDKVYYKDKLILPEKRDVYILLNKPKEHITTVDDQFGRDTVMDLIDEEERLFPVGRLDYDTRGLLLITNDGDLSYKLTHPKYEVEKTYLAYIKGIPRDNDIKKLREGIDIGDFVTSPAKVEIINTNGGNSLVKISIIEGKNRQVRRMFDSINCPVIDLERISFGGIELGSLKEGNYRYLTKEEVNKLKKVREKSN